MKDAFINSGLLYEKIASTIKTVTEEILQANRYCDQLYKTDYLPEDLRQKQSRVLDGTCRAWKALEELKKSFHETKYVRKQAIAIPDRKRIERMTVIRGGLYSPPARVDDCLSDKFRAFPEKERLAIDSSKTKGGGNNVKTF